MADRPSPVLAAYRAASRIVELLPGPVTDVMASAASLALAQAQRDKREIIGRHLQRVAGGKLNALQLRRAVDRAFDSYGRYYVDSFRIPSLTAAEIDAHFSYEGFGYLDSALEQGKGAVLVLPHLGGWEWAGRWIADRGRRITVVVEALEPPELFEWFATFRESQGMTVVPLGPSAGAACLKALRNNEVLCLLCDRDLNRDGPVVTFFGEETTLPAGPATLALRTGAPVIPTAVYFTAARDGHRAVLLPPIAYERRGSFRADVQAFTQLIASELERLIRQAPDQWHLFQPNWPSDPGYGP